MSVPFVIGVLNEGMFCTLLRLFVCLFVDFFSFLRVFGSFCTTYSLCTLALVAFAAVFVVPHVDSIVWHHFATRQDTLSNELDRLVYRYGQTKIHSKS